MKKLNELKNKIDSLNKSNLEMTEALKNEALEILSKDLDKNEELKKLISKVESSKELTQVEYDGFFHTWIRADFSKFIDLKNNFEKELFSEYMQENHFCCVDFKNDCISTAIGPCILINDEGDILDQDSGKWIISKKDYDSTEKRNEMIEAYMTKSGYFPSVIECDRYGNAFFVNTTGEK